MRWSRNNFCLQDSYQDILERLSSRKYLSAHHHILAERDMEQQSVYHHMSGQKMNCSVESKLATTLGSE